MGSQKGSRLWKMRGVDLGKEVGLETRFHFLTNLALLETSVCSQNRPAGNTDPSRIGSNAYGSTRLIELMTNLLFTAGGDKSFPLKKA